MAERPILMSGPMVLATKREVDPKTQTRRVVQWLYNSLTIGARLNPNAVAFTQSNLVPISWYVHHKHGSPTDGLFAEIECPYGKPGDRLWVRETWKPVELDEPEADAEGEVIMAGTDGIRFKADNAFQVIENTQQASERWCDVRRPSERWPKCGPVKWRPSIHMPRWACRLVLEIKAVRIERLLDISYEDILAEGVRIPASEDTGGALLRLTGKYPPCDYISDETAKAFYDGSGGDHTSDLLRAHFASLWDSLNERRGYGWGVNPWVWVIEFEVVT